MTNEELLERLEAEAKVSDAEPEELTVAVESDIEETQDRVDELERENNELESRVDELEDEVDDKESEVEELQDEIDAVAEVYAEALSETTPAFDAEELMERYEVTELREKYEDAVEDEEVEELGSGPAPESGDDNAGGQEAEEAEEAEPIPEDVSKVTELMETAGGAWADVAADVQEDYE